jgi:hypothetical protein
MKENGKKYNEYSHDCGEIIHINSIILHENKNSFSNMIKIG